MMAITTNSSISVKATVWAEGSFRFVAQENVFINKLEPVPFTGNSTQMQHTPNSPKSTVNSLRLGDHVNGKIIVLFELPNAPGGWHSPRRCSSQFCANTDP